MLKINYSGANYSYTISSIHTKSSWVATLLKEIWESPRAKENLARGDSQISFKRVAPNSAVFLLLAPFI